MKINIQIRGTAPLLSHNIQLADPMNPIARAMKVISSKRKKTDEDYIALARLEFEGGLYMHPELGPYLPGANIEKSFVEGARITKQGKQVERGLFVLENEAPLLYDGPRAVDAMWNDERFRSSMAVKVGQSRVMRSRPMFRDWAIECTAELDEGMLNLSTLQEIAEDAGSKVGLGDYRPRFGRFSAVIS